MGAIIAAAVVVVLVIIVVEAKLVTTVATRAATNAIDAKFKQKDEEKKEHRQRIVIDQRRMDAHAGVIKKLDHGLNQFKKNDDRTKDWWNGEYGVAIDFFMKVEHEKEQFDRELLAKLQERK